MTQQNIAKLKIRLEHWRKMRDGCKNGNRSQVPFYIVLDRVIKDIEELLMDPRNCSEVHAENPEDVQ